MLIIINNIVKIKTHTKNTYVIILLLNNNNNIITYK